jgi:hypothetical protein
MLLYIQLQRRSYIMQVVKYALGTVLIAAAMVAGSSKPAYATNGVCDIPKLSLGEATGKGMSVQNGKISASFVVEGHDCTTPVTLAVWKSPSANGQPINDQKLFGHVTKTFGPGQHTLTADVPDCYFQADLLVGSNPTAPDGTPNYAYQNGQILSVHPLRDWKYGGDKVCEEPKTPEQPKVPQVQAAQTTPAKLPSTGAGAVASTFFGVSASAGLAHAIVRRFRK